MSVTIYKPHQILLLLASNIITFVTINEPHPASLVLYPIFISVCLKQSSMICDFPPMMSCQRSKLSEILQHFEFWIFGLGTFHLYFLISFIIGRCTFWGITLI